MSWRPEDVTVVVNPAARGGQVGRRWDTLRGQLEAHLGAVDFVHTESAGHGRTLARAALDAGATTIISLGGDGTHGEVSAGLVEAGGQPTLGILHAGTGGDFRRLLAHAGSLLECAEALPKAAATPIDVGEVICLADDGSEHRQVFINLASAGMSGLVDRMVNASSKRLGGKLTFLWCTIKALFKYRPARIRLWVDGEDQGEHTVFMLAVANGRWAGGGMCFAPNAMPDDGQFDVVVIPKRGLLRSLATVPGLYSGKYIEADDVLVFRGSEIRAEPVGDDVAWMDVDGEAPGRLPATFTLKPSAIRLLDLDRPRLLGLDDGG